MRSSNKAVSAVALAGALMFSLVPSVHARSLAAVAGRASNNSQSECAIADQSPVGTSGSAFGVRNNCVAVVSWKMALPVDLPASYVVTVRAIETGSGSINCSARTMDNNGNGVGLEALAGTANMSGFQTLTMSPPAVPAGGTLLLTCLISGTNNAKLLSVNW